MSNPRLYRDSLHQYSIDSFLALKENAALTRGFRRHFESNQNESSFYQNIYYSSYGFLLYIFVVFLGIWFLEFLSRSISNITKYPQWKIGACIIVLGVFLFMVYYSYMINQYHISTGVERRPILLHYLIKGSFVVVPLLILFNYLKKNYWGHLQFADKEAVGFICILIGGILLSYTAANIEFYLIDRGIINSPFWRPDGMPRSAQFHLAPFSIFVWINIAIANFLNNFRKYFIQLRKKAVALKSAQESELHIQSELKTLQSKINPHFLYNSLNSIASLSQENPAKTEEMAIALSNFYKYNTNRKDERWTTIKDEMDMLAIYLQIEKIRFGDRLKINMEASEETESINLPRFLLQPIVENGIKYGYNAATNTTEIGVQVIKSGDELVIRIQDSGKPFTEDMASGYGLESVRKKLKLLFPDKHQMEFVNAPVKEVVIRIII